MYSMVQAGSMGLPFISVRGLLGSDILKHRPDLRVIKNPFNPDEEVVIAQPIRPDVSVFHALKADRWGNAITPGLRDDLMMARAAKRVIVTTEEVSDRELNSRDAVNETFLPAMDVDGVVHLSFGAHPCSCGNQYPADEFHLKEYLEASREEGTFRSYLKKYVYDVHDHKEYLERVGMTGPDRGGNI
jgi:glutaconate CoA-transferase, subunit A